MIWIPFLAVLLMSGSLLYKKQFFRHSRIPETTFLATSSVLLAFVTSLLLLLTGGWFNLQGTFQHLSVLQLVVLASYLTLAMLAVWIYYKGFRVQKVTKIELMSLIQTVATIVFAALILPAERNPVVWVGALLVIAIFAVSHIRRHHFKLHKGEQWLLAAAILFALDNVLATFLLDAFRPLELYTLRMIVSALVFSSVFHVRFRLRVSSWSFGTVVSALSSFAVTMAIYYSFTAVGASITRLVFLFEPIILVAWSMVVWHQRESLRFLVSSGAILVIVYYLLQTQG